MRRIDLITFGLGAGLAGAGGSLVSVMFAVYPEMGQVYVFKSFLVIVLGPPLVWVWGRGLVELWRRPEWRPVRLLVPAFGLVVVFTFAVGSQSHYPTFRLIVLLAAGCTAGVCVAWPWLVLNAAVAVVVSLPVLPIPLLGSTPVPAMNLLGG